MTDQLDPIDRAVRNLGIRRTFRSGDRSITLACLIRQADWRPLQAEWWRGKEVYVMGADLDGNFLLRHCDGTVRLWDHRAQADTVIAKSVKDFIAGIAE